MKKQSILLLGFGKKGIKYFSDLFDQTNIYLIVKKNFERSFFASEEGINLLILNKKANELTSIIGELKSFPYLKNTPIILYTPVDKDSILNCFHAGIDDFIDADLPAEIIKAKIEAILKCKKSEKKPINKKIKFANIVINSKKRKVTRKGIEVNLTKIEYDILCLLANDKTKIFTRDEIYQHVWGKNIIVGERTLDVHMNNLRKKIGKSKIATKKGIGFGINSIYNK
jgi:two-component system alkaline phosphatase synthesis response regulator PhoP